MVQSDKPFRVDEVNLATGETTVIIQKGILGALANQLTITKNQRKGASIIRKLGHVLRACGDIQYGGEVDESNLDPSLIVNES